MPVLYWRVLFNTTSCWLHKFIVFERSHLISQIHKAIHFTPARSLTDTSEKKRHIFSVTGTSNLYHEQKRVVKNKYLTKRSATVSTCIPTIVSSRNFSFGMNSFLMHFKFLIHFNSKLKQGCEAESWKRQ